MEKRKLKSIVNTLFLGALGSGIWSVVGDPAAGFIYSNITVASGWFSEMYGDIVNRNIGSGGWGDRASVTWLVFFFWGLAYFMFSLSVKNPYFGNKVLVMLATFFLFSGSIVTHKSIYSMKASLYFERNIEIIAPYISSKEALELRASFRKIESLKTFNEAQAHLLRTAKRAGIAIDEFTL